MKIDRELLKALFLSAKLRKFLRFSFLILFFYLSFIVVKELANFYIAQSRFPFIEYSGISASISDRKLKISAKNLVLRGSKLCVEVENGRLVVDILGSLKNFAPVFDELNATAVTLRLKGGGRGKRFAVPIRVNRLYVETLRCFAPHFRLRASHLRVGSGFVEFGGVGGYFKEVPFWLSPARGTLSEGYYHFAELKAGFAGAVYSGSAGVSRNLKDIYLSGILKAGGRSAWILLTKEKNRLLLTGVADVAGRTVKGHLEGTVERGRILVERASLSFKGATFDFKGTLGRKLSLKGSVKAKRFRISSATFHGVKGTFSASGAYLSPVVECRLSAGLLETPATTVKGLNLKVTYRDVLKVTLRSPSIDVDAKLVNDYLDGRFRLKGFDVQSLTFFTGLPERHRKWLPAVVLSGSGTFSKWGNTFKYAGTFAIERFLFKGFKGSGTLTVRGSNKLVDYLATIAGHGGTLRISGRVNLLKGSLNTAFTGRNLPVQAFDFLKRAGIEGRADCSGEVHGSFGSLKGSFRFSSKDFAFRKVPVGAVRGEGRIDGKLLRIKGERADGAVRLSYLVLHLGKPTSIEIGGEVSHIPTATVVRVLKSFKVRLPLELYGEVTGDFYLHSENVKRVKSNLLLSVNILQSRGGYSAERLSGVFSRLTGNILFKEKRLVARFKGRNDSLRLADTAFSGGSFLLEVHRNRLALYFEGVKPAGAPGVAGEGSIAMNLRNRNIGGIVHVSGSCDFKGLNIKGHGRLLLSGTTGALTLRVEGSTTLSHALLASAVVLRVSGAVEAPSGVGNIALENENCRLRLLFLKGKLRVVGVARNIPLKAGKARIVVGTSFVDIDPVTLSGRIAVPAFEVFPEGFYRLYSVSGIYIDVERARLTVSGTRLAYLDGWLELENTAVKGKSISGAFRAELGVKGLLRKKGLEGTFSYARGKVVATGSYTYADKALQYSADFEGVGLEGRLKYVLDRVDVVTLKGRVHNGSLTYLFAEATAGDGTLVLNLKEGEAVFSLSSVSAGEVGRWKGVLSGTGTFKDRKVTGRLTATKTKVLFGERSAPTAGKAVRLPVDVALAVNFASPVVLEAPVFKLALLPRLRITTESSRLKITGAFYIVEGFINYMGKKFQVLYGTGVLDDLARQCGSVNLLASAYLSGYYVYMNIKGNVKEPKLFLTSDPPLTREQILNLIMTGASPEQVEKSSEVFPAVQVAYYATSSVFKPIEKQFKQAFKLESFSIEPYITKYGETVARLSVAKRLARRVRLLGYQTTGQKPEYGGSAGYFLTGHYYLETRYNSYYGAEAGIGIEFNVR